MAVFGLSDPYIISAFIACFLCVALCVGWGLFRKNEDDDEGEEK